MNVEGNGPVFIPLAVQFQKAVTQQGQTNDGQSQGKGFEAILENMQTGDPATEQRATLHSSPVLATALAALELGVELASGYSLQVAIGDEALAFQARAIVGPVAIAPESDQELGFPMQIAGTSSAQLPSSNEGIRAEDASDRLDMAPRFFLLPSDTRCSASATTSKASPLPSSASRTRAAVAPLGKWAQMAQLSAPIASRAVRESQAASVPAQAEATSGGQAEPTRATLFAQLVAAAQEYRVAVRGAKLSIDERERLIADIRAALRSFGLVDLPITLTSISQKGTA